MAIQTVPEDCITKMFRLSGSAPKYATVCRSWNSAVKNCYQYILKEYQENNKTKPFTLFIHPIAPDSPDYNDLCREAVKQVYHAVMSRTRAPHIIEAELIGLDRSGPLDLSPVVETVENANLVQFFKEGVRQHIQGETPPLAGNLARQSTAIRNWMENHQRSLNEMIELTFDLNLTTLFPEIGKFENLQILWLDGNHLVALPPEIRNCTKLRYLSLTNNRLLALSPEMDNWTNLRSLNLTQNELHHLPQNIDKCIGLEKLWLNDNHLTALPIEVSSWTNLKTLDLGGNKLADLSRDIGKCTNLTSLRFYSNKLTNLPPEIGKLENLHELSLRANQLVTLPPEIGNCIKLRNLALKYNKTLSTLPKTMSQLTNLNDLELSNIHLMEIQQHPRQLELIPSLCTLDKIIGAFKEGQPEEALEIFKGLSADSKNGIYAELYEIIRSRLKNDYWGCSEDAFLKLNGQDASNVERVQAIWNFIDRR